jgi:hypothetical protein
MEELQKLFNVLKREGYYTKSFEDFQSKYQDETYRDKVFNVVSRDGFYTKSKEEFLSKFSLGEVKKKRRIRAFFGGGHYGIYYRASSGRKWFIGISAR